LIYNDLDFIIKQKTTKKKIIIIDLKKRKKINEIIFDNPTQEIEEYIWIDNNNFAILGYAGRGNRILTFCNIKENKVDFLIGGSYIRISPNKRRVIFISARHPNFSEEVDSDNIRAIDLDYIYSLDKKSRDASNYIRELYPVDAERRQLTKFNILDDKYFIVGDIGFMWLDNDNVSFVGDYKNTSYFIIFKFNKFVDDFDIKKIPLKNKFEIINSMSKKDSQVIIEGLKLSENNSYVKIIEAVKIE